MKTVRILWFSLLREKRGLGEESIQTSALTTAELYLELDAKHQLNLNHQKLRSARNDHFCSWDAEIFDGDTIAFIPPVAGG